MSFVKKMEPFIPKDYREEIRGMADGCGIAYDDMLYAHTFIDVFHSQIIACSTVGIAPERSTTGHTLFGRNLDFPSLGFVHKFSMVIVYQPKNKPAFVSIAWPGLAGVLTGFNQHGLSLGMLSIQFEDYNKDGGFPLFWLFRYILENCKNISEAIAILENTKLSVASNLTLADPKDVAVAELLPGNKRFRRASSGVIHSVNHYQHPDIKKFIPSGTYTSSYVRSTIISTLLKEGPEKMDSAYVKKIMEAVCIKGINLQSMVIIPEKKEILLGIGYDDSAKKPFILLKETDLFPKTSSPK
jgi:predicted choloylglycine hydrolase